MKKLLLLAASLAATLVVLPGSARAITGNFVEDNEHPFIGLVAFYDDEGNFMWRCSGSLLTDRVFLTAGHCTDQDAEESPAMARIWFHQDVGGAFDPVTGAEDPNTGYPNRCLPGDPLCAESTLLFDFGFDNFAGFPNIHDVGLIILPEDQAVELPEYGVLAPAGFLDSLADTLKNATFTVAGYGVSRTNPAQTVSFRERLMALTQRILLNESRNTAGFNLQLSSAPGGGRGGTCFGDSGGPTFYGGFSSNVIVGVNSWLFGFNRQTCGGTGFAFRTDTEAVVNWILEIVAKYAPDELDEIQFAEL
jgi:Trypsin